MNILPIRFSELVHCVRRWIKLWKKKDDNDWFDHPYAIF